jgi:hypothetical protein
MKHNSDARWPLVHRRSCWQARRVRTVPIPAWAKTAIDAWTTAAGIGAGYLFRPVTSRNHQPETFVAICPSTTLDGYRSIGLCRFVDRKARAFTADLSKLDPLRNRVLSGFAGQVDVLRGRPKTLFTRQYFPSAEWPDASSLQIGWEWFPAVFSGDERRLPGNTKQGRSTWEDYFRSADLTRWVT